MLCYANANAAWHSIEVLVSSDLVPTILNSEISQEIGTSARTELFLFVNCPHPYTKNSQLKMKIVTFLESDFYCLLTLFQMLKKGVKQKGVKQEMPIAPPFS